MYVDNKITVIILCTVVFLAGCESNTNQDNYSDEFTNSDTLIVDDELFLNGSDDAYEIISAAIMDDNLRLVINYDGGCGSVFYNLLAPTSYIETAPFQKNIRLGFDDNDMCEAGIEVELIFDMSIIQKSGTERIFINLDKWSEQLEYIY